MCLWTGVDPRSACSRPSWSRSAWCSRTTSSTSVGPGSAPRSSPWPTSSAGSPSGFLPPATGSGPSRSSSGTTSPRMPPCDSGSSNCGRGSGWAGQYEWLARFARWRQLSSLELAIHRDDRAYDFVHSLVERGDDGRYRLRQPIEDPALEVFEPFVFPSEPSPFRLTKLGHGPHRRGKARVLGHSRTHVVLSHTGGARGRPCGRVQPVPLHEVDEGLAAARVPRINRLKYEVRRAGSRAPSCRWSAPVGKVLRGWNSMRVMSVP